MNTISLHLFCALCLCFAVSLAVDTVTIHIESPVNITKEVEPNKTLGECGFPIEAFNYHLFVKGSDPLKSVEYNQDSIINDSIDLVPYYMVTVKGQMKKNLYVDAAKNGTDLLDEVASLKKYLESNEYAVGDSDTNGLLDDKAIIIGDLNIVVIKRNVVVVELEEQMKASDVNVDMIAMSISNLAKLDESQILIDFDEDKKGYVKSILVILDDIKDSEKVVEVVNNKGENVCGVATFDLKSKADANTVLRNPDKGWYLHYYDDGTWNYGKRKSAEYILGFMPYLDHVYMRVPWVSLEKEEGTFTWSLIDNVINDFTPKGVGVSYRITCKEGGDYCPYATPEWVKNAGASGTMMSDKSWEPDYGDPIFLEKLENFHKAFAERYAGKEYNRYIDVGSYGMYGEGHNSGSSNKKWPWSAIEKHFDLHREYYPNDQIVISDDFVGSGHVSDVGTKGAKIREYVTEHGWSYRDDSICVDWYMDHYYDTDTVRSPFLFEEVWQTHPVVMELQHYSSTVQSGTWRNGAIFRRACKRTHATYAGWHGFVDEFMKGDNIAYAAEMANLLGYWYFLDKAELSCAGENVTCKLSLRNEGFSNAHHIYSFDLILRDSKGNNFTFPFKDFDNTIIMPKNASDPDAVAPVYDFSQSVNVDGLTDGTYSVSIRMHKGDKPVWLALKDSLQNADGQYELGKITLKPMLSHTKHAYVLEDGKLSLSIRNNLHWIIMVCAFIALMMSI